MTKEEILDMLLLEQFLVNMKDRTQRWVKHCQPKSSSEAVRLAEDFTMVEGEGY